MIPSAEKIPRLTRLTPLSCKALFLFSFVIVAWGQPTLIGPLGAVSAAIGFALFFLSLSSEGLSGKKKGCLSVLWFAGVQLIQLSWMTSIEFQGYYILVVYGLLAITLGLQFALFSWIVPSQGTLSWGCILACASLWTCLEWSRLFVLCGFSWNPVGLSLCYFETSLQWASLWGILGLSFWVMLTNLTLLNLFRSSFTIRMGMAAAILVFLPYIFGLGHLQYHARQAEKKGKNLSVALIQTALLPSEKTLFPERVQEFVAPFKQWFWIVEALAPLPKTDLIVFPEAAVPFPAEKCLYPLDLVQEGFISLLGPSCSAHFPPLVPPYAQIGRNQTFVVSNLFWAQTLSNYFHADIVAGFDHIDREAKKNFNSAFYLRPNCDQVERYDKQILLPLAEYLPFSFLKTFTQTYGIVDFFTPGAEFKVWGLLVPFSPCICYEETFSALMRRTKGLGAQMIVNVTNDNYYPDSSLHSQHFFHARLRAVENGVPLVRSCNGGISAVIDSLGRITAQKPVGQEGVLVSKVNTYVYHPLFFWCGETGLVNICLIWMGIYWGRQWGFKRKIALENRLN